MATSLVAAIISAISSAASAIGGAASAVSGATGLTSLGTTIGTALTGAGTGLAGATGSGALGSAGTTALGTIAPEVLAGTSFAGPTAAMTIPEVATMLPGAASMASLPPSFSGGGMMASLGQSLPSLSTALEKGLDTFVNPGKTMGGQVGKLMGNEKLGQQVGQVGQILASSSQKGGGDNRPPPAPPGMPGISVAQAPPMPGMGGQGGPSFHVNPQTGILEYS